MTEFLFQDTGIPGPVPMSKEPFNRQGKSYEGGNNLGKFQNQVNPKDVNPDAGNSKIQTAEYKKTHQYSPPETNSFYDEYAGPAMEQVKL